jgi:predicted membrane channel-forming protein YqfA (hemolysin III family)
MKRFVLTLVILSCATVGVGYAGAFWPGGAPFWAPWCMAIGTNGALMSLLALGASRRGTLPAALIWTFVGLFVLCAGAFAYALAVPAAEGAGGALLGGLPIRTAILLYSVGVAPIVILPFAYALTFDKSTLSDDDLVQVRAAHEAMKRGGSA